MLDAYELFQLPREKPLRIVEARHEEICVLCGGPLSPGNWWVALPKRKGHAHTHCAGDHGWTLK